MTESYWTVSSHMSIQYLHPRPGLCTSSYSSNERGLEDSIQTTWPEKQGRVDRQRNIKLPYRRETIGQTKTAYVHHSKYAETQGDHTTAVRDTLRVLNDHLGSPHPTPSQGVSRISHSDLLIPEEQRGK